MRRKIAGIIAAVLLMAGITGCGGNTEDSGQNPQKNTLQDSMQAASEYLTAQVSEPGISSIGGEWTVIGLARSGAETPEGYFGIYHDNVRAAVKAARGVLNEKMYTEYARVSLAVKAIGEAPTDVEGYDLLAPLDDRKAVIGQGINGSIYALIAAKSCGYELKNQQKYLAALVDAQMDDGGFSYVEGSEQAAPDMTAMALQALALYQEDAIAAAAAERAVEALAAVQKEDGTFTEQGSDEASSETVSQVIIALTEMEIDPLTDERFIKDGKTLYDVLMGFQIEGGFCHLAGGQPDVMATEQALCALAALKQYEDGGSLYRF